MIYMPKQSAAGELGLQYIPAVRHVLLNTSNSVSGEASEHVPGCTPRPQRTSACMFPGFRTGGDIGNATKRLIPRHGEPCCIR